jgi:hypothetical protein
MQWTRLHLMTLGQAEPFFDLRAPDMAAHNTSPTQQGSPVFDSRGRHSQFEMDKRRLIRKSLQLTGKGHLTFPPRTPDNIHPPANSASWRHCRDDIGLGTNRVPYSSYGEVGWRTSPAANEMTMQRNINPAVAELLEQLCRTFSRMSQKTPRPAR